MLTSKLKLELAVNPLGGNPTKCLNTQTIRRQIATNCLSVFDHFVGLALEGLICIRILIRNIFRTQSDI